MTAMYYDGNCTDYHVEANDIVEVEIDGTTSAGQVVALHPRSGQVTVRYEDHHDCYRTTGNPRRKSVRVDLSDVDLVRRDG